MKLPAHTAELPGKDNVIYIVPLDPVYTTRLAGYVPASRREKTMKTKLSIEQYILMPVRGVRAIQPFSPSSMDPQPGADDPAPRSPAEAPGKKLKNLA